MSFESRAIGWRASATLHLSGTVHSTIPYKYMPDIINLCFYRSHAYYRIAMLIQSPNKNKQTSILTKNFEFKKKWGLITAAKSKETRSMQ